MSGYTDDTAVRHGLVEQGVPFLQKPITPGRWPEGPRGARCAPPLTPAPPPEQRGGAPPRLDGEAFDPSLLHEQVASRSDGSPWIPLFRALSSFPCTSRVCLVIAPLGQAICRACSSAAARCSSRTCSRNTEDREAVNRLLVVGFYLFYLGYACLLLKAINARPVTEAVEALAGSSGAPLSLGAMHFFNMYLFLRIRRRSQARGAPAAGRAAVRVDCSSADAQPAARAPAHAAAAVRGNPESPDLAVRLEPTCARGPQKKERRHGDADALRWPLRALLRCRDFLAREPHLVPLEFVPCASVRGA